MPTQGLRRSVRREPKNCLPVVNVLKHTLSVLKFKLKLKFKLRLRLKFKPSLAAKPASPWVVVGGWPLPRQLGHEAYMRPISDLKSHGREEKEEGEGKGVVTCLTHQL